MWDNTPPHTMPERAPLTNLERQRLFAERHPHYYRDRRRREKAEMEARMAAAAERAAAAAPIPAAPLALPAPPEEIFIELPLFAQRELEPVEVGRSAPSEPRSVSERFDSTGRTAR